MRKAKGQLIFFNGSMSMKASKKCLAIVTVAVLAIALLCVNGCKKSEEPEAQSGTASTASVER